MRHFFRFRCMSRNFSKFWQKSVKFQTWRLKWKMAIEDQICEIYFKSQDFFILYHFWHLLLKNRHISRLFLTHFQGVSKINAKLVSFFTIRCQKRYKMKKTSHPENKISLVIFKNHFIFLRYVWNFTDLAEMSKNFRTWFEMKKVTQQNGDSGIFLSNAKRRLRIFERSVRCLF